MLEILGQCAHVEIPEMSEEAIRFYRSGMILWVVQQVWSLLLPWLFLITGFSGKLASFAQEKGKFWYVSLSLYLLVFIALYQLISLPLDVYFGYLRPLSYGLSSQSLGEWFIRYGKGVLLLLGSVLTFVWIFYVLNKKKLQTMVALRQFCWDSDWIFHDGDPTDLGRSFLQRFWTYEK
jgi:hypothetical protein